MAHRTAAPHLGGRLRSSINRWASAATEEARQLRSETVEAGCCPIVDAADRQLVSLHGTLRTVTLRPRGGVPALEAELYDGSGLLTLVWLGRRRIAGPRWLLRASMYGRPAREWRPDGLLESMLKEVVVDRGSQPMTPGEALPLRLPAGAQRVQTP